MTDYDDLPLERESRDLPMSLLADGVAEHYGRTVMTEKRITICPKSGGTENICAGNDDNVADIRDMSKREGGR